MTTIAFNTVVETVRFIDGRYGEPFRAILTIQWLGPETVYISGLKGEFTRDDYRRFYKEIHARGARYEMRSRHGTMEFREIKVTA